MERSNSGGWELSKENIQPLSSGRRMAYLAESLPSQGGGVGLNDLQHEAFHLEEIRKLEEIAEQQIGDDPIQAWVDLMKYIEQHFPVANSKIQTRRINIVKKAVQQCYNNERYRNDVRYVKLLLASIENLPAATQARAVRSFLDNEFGELVSDMYIKAAELYQAAGDDKSASEILRRGIKINAEPRCRLDEMLTHIQNSWAEKFAKKLNDEPSGSRNFASSVPIIGETNEAVPIRQDLQAAGPATAKPMASANQKIGIKNKIPIYRDENGTSTCDVENHGPQQIVNPVLNSLNREEQDHENRLEPSRWNTGSTHISTPAIPEPPPKFQLYAEPTNEQSCSKLVKMPPAVDTRVLKERTEDIDESGSSPQIQIVVREVSEQRREIIEPKLKRIHVPTAEEKPYFEDIKYKPLPPGRKVNRVMLKYNKWLSEYEECQKQKQVKKSEVVQISKEVEQLSKTIEILEEKLNQQHRLSELKLLQKDEKIRDLESKNEEMLNQLTRISTSNNVRESQINRERQCYEEKIHDLQSKLNARLRLEEELQMFKNKCEELEEKLAQEAESLKGYESEEIIVEKKATFVDIEVQSCNNYASSSQSASNKFGNEESPMAANSFLPDLGNEKSMSYVNVEPIREREKRVLANRYCEPEMMNITPAAAPPMDMDIPPPNLSLFRKPSRAFSLYESISDSFSKPNPTTVNPVSINRRYDFVKNLQGLSENVPPQQPPSASDENAVSEPPFSPQENVPCRSDLASNERNDENQFLRPASIPHRSSAFLPSNESSHSHVPNEHGNIIGGRFSEVRKRQSLRPHTMDGFCGDGSDEEDVILRRHQQTGVDLNVSNLTTVLSLGPRPLTNSTPEKPKQVPVGVGTVGSEQTESDEQGRIPRYNSILIDPPLNLSTIQETSRENRSRSTTGSSSGNITASTTRFGMATNTTQFTGNVTRSSSIPRTGGHISHHYSNGYYSDSNAK